MNLAAFDAFDTGLSVLGAGCGNAVRYSSPPSTLSYRVAADLFADDELYVDTGIGSCTLYMALEMQYATTGAGTKGHTTCGGRMPSHDVVDMTYSVLAGGLGALDVPSNNYAPRIHDGVAVHGDIKETVFPFLGPPHP